MANYQSALIKYGLKNTPRRMALFKVLLNNGAQTNSEVAERLKLSESIQWDYKNIVKRKGVLKRLN